MRIVLPGMEDDLTYANEALEPSQLMSTRWDCLEHLQRVFTELNLDENSWYQRNADRITGQLKQLAQL